MINKFIYTIIFFLSFLNLGAQEICNNGLDDNGNGLTDCEEPSCYFNFNACACTNVDVIWALTTERTIIWINLLTGEERLVGTTEAGRDISWSPDGNLYTNDVSSTIKKIDYTNGSTLTTQNIGLGGDGMVVGDDGIFYYGIGELVKTYNPNGGAISTLTTITGYKCSGDLAFLGSKLLVSLEQGASGSGDSYVAIVDRASGTYTLVKILTTLKKPFGLESNANGIVYISFDDKIYILNTTTGAISLVYTSSLTARFSGLAILSRKCDCDFTADIFPTTNLCSNDTLFVNQTATEPVTISWILPNGNTVNQNFVTPLVDGQYIVIVKTATCPEVRDTLNLTIGQTVAPFNIGNDTAYCGNFSKTLSTGNPNTLWSNGQIGASISVNSGGLYWAEINGGCGKFRDSILLTQNAFPLIDLGNDTSICQNSSIVLDATTSGATYLWNNGSTDATISVFQPQIYSVIVTKNGCSSTDSRQVSILPSSSLFVGNDTAFCDLINQTISSGNSQTVWSNGQIGSFININQFGTYWGEITTSCGKIRDSILISQKIKPSVNLGNDQSICEGDTIILNAYHVNATYLWSTGENDASIEISNAGTYMVEVDLNGCKSNDTMVLFVDHIPSFTLGNDTTYCGNFDLTLTTDDTSTRWSTGDKGSNIIVSQAGIYWAEISNSCGKKRDSIQLFTKPSPSVNIGPDQMICSDTILLNGYNPSFITYKWNNGLSDSSISVTKPGLYFLFITDQNGCNGYDEVNIVENCHDEIFVPTAFSPNLDGINEGFQILYDPKYIKILQLNVFNRWGELVFESNNNNYIWDGTFKGKSAPIDQYLWWVEYLALESNQTITQKGTVIIVK